jgi:hypothetical protein
VGRAVPAPILRSCLDDMAGQNIEADFDSDDDEGGDSQPKKKKAKTNPDDPFSGSLLFKGGKTAMNSLYYVDYSKCKNGGNHDAEAYNDLNGKQIALANDLNALTMDEAALAAAAKKLASERTNEEATVRFTEESNALEKLREQVGEARKHLVNEDRPKKLKKAIFEAASEWRKRKRVGMDGYYWLEEATDGVITIKKCLSGDGAIDMDSDEGTLALARDLAIKHRQAPSKNVTAKKVGKLAWKSSTGLSADPNFIGVLLDARGNVQRQYLIDE